MKPLMHYEMLQVVKSECFYVKMQFS